MLVDAVGCFGHKLPPVRLHVLTLLSAATSRVKRSTQRGREVLRGVLSAKRSTNEEYCLPVPAQHTVQQNSPGKLGPGPRDSAGGKQAGQQQVLVIILMIRMMILFRQ